MTANHKKKGRGPGPRPDMWKSGPDETAHDQYNGWIRHRAQAHFRHEPHELTYAEWCAIWNQDDAWAQRGRGIDCLCLCMIEPDWGWSVANVEILDRKTQLLNSGRSGQGRKKPRRTVLRAAL